MIGIVALIAIRQKNHPRSAAGEQGRRSRFFGSNWGQAYFVEIIILLVTICIISLRSQEAALYRYTDPDMNLLLHFPLTYWLSFIWSPLSEEWLRESIIVVAAIKILVSFTWMIVVSLTPTMGVAWHRFLAFFNIWFKRHADGRTSLGALQPMQVNGQAVTAENLEEIMEAAEEETEDEDEPALSMGAGHVKDFTWKQMLDFSTCTECGRCQSQCPAWNTDKPLSPKMLMMTLRDHANEMAPWLRASAEDRRGLPEHTRKLAEVPLVGATGYESDHPLGAYDALGPDAIIDSDVLWSCTTCGACVEQCPVDIEHVDAIVDMRRHQVLIESAFPAEFGGLFKNLESKQNPWGMAPKMRLDWAKGLEFDIPVVGVDVEDLGDVDYLFWVGCAGAFEDRAKKTTRAVAELLHEADVSFAVLGEGEACTGDSARRAGNEILYQMLAAQNVEMLNEVGAKKIVVTCAHCFNTLRNEYPQNGGQYEVLHHTQLLNRLVREKRLVPVSRPEEHPGLSTAKKVQSTAATVTYHDPCYLGRHNDVYAPPRELIGALPGVELREMPRHGMKSFCCGAGGARMWAEENLGTRVNLNRTAEAVETGADRIAVGCPFCRVMLTDGLTAMQSEDTAREEVEVVDVAQMLLAAVRRGETPDESDVDTPDAAGQTGTAAASAPAEDVEAAKEEAAEGGSPEVETSDATAKAADEARAEQATEPAPAEQEQPAQAPAKGGKMSAADALAMMQAQGSQSDDADTKAPEATAEATPAAETTASQPAAATSEAAEAPKAEMPKGKMSAADALAMMGGAAAGTAQTPEKKDAAPEPTAEATTPADADAQAGQSSAPAAPAPKAEMPKGKMSAADALAMMQAQAPAAEPEAQKAAPTASATQEEPAKTVADDAASTPEAAPAVQDTTPTPSTTEPAAEPAAQKSAATPAPAARKAPVEMPKGKMSASEALAMMQAQAPAATSEPDAAADTAPAEAEPVDTAPADTAPASEPETQAAAPESAAAPEPEPEPVATESATTDEAEARPQPTTETTAASAPATCQPAVTQSAPAKPAPTKRVEMPSGRMSASEALALLGGMAAPAADEPEAPAQPEAEATPSAQPETAQAPTEDASTETTPASAATVTTEPAAPAETETPAASPTPEAAPAPEAASDGDAPKAPASAPARVDTGAWARLQEAAGGKPIAASEALKILGGS
ncbi:hypothetical protein GCM10025883_32090 [Mobilicoccus caccae]|uniref:4Fe-4S ferredoxin-type domain-containing protein n=1 Tax=Mobilicoccus caccae TaxID=1859295 RepID=A0ABQ6IUK5_9MICO|nr:hypothetical protein GCM10025883_32090 [Mobilicoccus caccae]